MAAPQDEDTRVSVNRGAVVADQADVLNCLDVNAPSKIASIVPFQ
jgi:hypothetical protein